MNAPDILFATIAAGGSHVASAQAMAEAVDAVAPGRFTTAQREIMRDYGFTAFDDKHKRSWQLALEHPWTAVWGQRVIDQVPGLCQLVLRRIMRDFARVATDQLNDDPPRLVVANHPFLSVGLTLAQKEFGLEVPVLTFQSTTLDATALWAVRGVQRMTMGSPVAHRILERMGVPAERMDVVGYPVRRGFLANISKAGARETLGLDSSTFTVLIALGGEGLGGSPMRVIQALSQMGVPLQIVVITGRNTLLRKQVESEVGKNPLIRIEGFVENMWDFLSAADVFVGKTGPASTLEALSRGCPVIATATSGGNENRIRVWLEKKGLGHFAPTPDALRTVVDGYRRDPMRLEAVSRAAAAWDFPDMSQRMGRYIAHFAETGLPDTLLRGPGVH